MELTLEHIENQIRAEDARTLTDRASRALQICRSFIIPMGPFALPSAECARLFRDGHFYGCISLAQAVTDAIIRHVYWAEFPDADRSIFGKLHQRLGELRRNNRIGDAANDAVEQIWRHRNDFHHLDPKTQIGERKLEEIAIEALTLLARIEEEFFSYSLKEGAISPDKPQYWNITDGKALIYVRGV